MTVIALDIDGFSVEVSPESIAKTTMGQWTVGTRINLERPLKASDRLGGHFVTGHVDGLATLIQKEADGIAYNLTFQLVDPTLALYFIPKGSVALAGISLTVNGIEDNQFWVTIIPHTMAHTNLNELHIGYAVHIETDMLGKYAARFLNARPQIQTEWDLALHQEQMV